MNKLLDIIVPVYGKDPKKTYENIKNLCRLITDEVGIIIVYKNAQDNSLNYDGLNKLGEMGAKVIKMSSKVKRTAKVKAGVSHSSSKYIMVLDAHHQIQDIEFEKTIRKLSKEKKSYDIIWQSYKVLDLDMGNKKPFYLWDHGKKWVHTAGKQIFLRESINLDLINYDIVFYDDSSLGFSVTFNKKTKEKIYPFKPYVRVWGAGVSSTHNNTSNIALKRQQKDLLTMLNSFFNKEIEISHREEFIYNRKHQYSQYFFFKRVILNHLLIKKIPLREYLKLNSKAKIKIFKEASGSDDLKTLYEILNHSRNCTFSIFSYPRFWFLREVKIRKMIKKYY